MNEQQTPIGMPAPTSKTILVEKVVTPMMWLSIGLGVGYMLANKSKKKVRE